MNSQRRLAIVRLDARAHPLERDDDSAHWPLRERRIADDNGTERMCGENARQQAHGRARVLRVERRSRGLQTSQAAPFDFDGQPVLCTCAADGDACGDETTE